MNIGKTKVINLLAKDHLFPDSLTKNKEGIFTLKRGFFYTNGDSSTKWAEGILNAIPEAKIISHREHWGSWPKRSFFEVKFTI